jgi:precorrin-3B C17-methyltransferase
VFEALEAGPAEWLAIPIAVEPGITAMLAAAARAGAPLGGDFCAISLSDNLKPWDVVTARLEAALAADFVICLYNPISKARPWQLGAALELAAKQREAETPVLFARAVGRPDEKLRVLTLAEAVAAATTADMATLVMIGASSTRLIARDGTAPYVYTPRSVTKSPCATSQGST